MKFDGEGCLKIFDFGLARDTNVEASTIGAIGTRGYMAPELFIATKSGRVSFTTAVDTYAFGATALAVALGHLPKSLTLTPPILPCKEADFSAIALQLPVDVAAVLNQCLDVAPSARPAMAEVAQVIAPYLLRDRHRALLVSGGKTYVLNKNTRVVQLTVSSQGSLKITYDGLRFVVSEVSGVVSINNIRVADGDALPGSCVIVLGATDHGAMRTMITVDVSHPEVMT